MWLSGLYCGTSIFYIKLLIIVFNYSLHIETALIHILSNLLYLFKLVSDLYYIVKIEIYVIITIITERLIIQFYTQLTSPENILPWMIILPWLRRDGKLLKKRLRLGGFTEGIAPLKILLVNPLCDATLP